VPDPNRGPCARKSGGRPGRALFEEPCNTPRCFQPQRCGHRLSEREKFAVFDTTFGSVMLSPFARFTLSEANGLRVNSAKHPRIFFALIELSNAGILRPPRRTQNHRRWRFALRMTNNPYDMRGKLLFTGEILGQAGIKVTTQQVAASRTPGLELFAAGGHRLCHDCKVSS
jgi:hypothetical protein